MEMKIKMRNEIKINKSPLSLTLIDFTFSSADFICSVNFEILSNLDFL